MTQSRQQKRQAVRDVNSLQNEYTLKFTKHELIVMYNALLTEQDGQPRLYRPGDGMIVVNVCTKMKPIVVVETNIPPEKQGVPEEEKKVVIGEAADAEPEDTAN